MILRPLFRKHVLLIFAVFIAILGICAFSTQYLMHYQMDEIFRAQADELLKQIEAHAGDKMAYVAELNELNRTTHSPVRIELRPSDDATEAGPGPHVTRPIEIDGQKMNLQLSLAPPPRGPPPPMGAGHGPPPMPLPFGPRHGPFGQPIVPFLALIFAVFLASAVSVVLIYRSFRDKAELAKDVLGKMQAGDLKARFPISKWDEASQIFNLYNRMADEIERLVDRLKQNEQTRVSLLQELAHDLRTPVATLHSAIETINFDEKALDETTKNELKTMALHEVEYLKRLVEDLLFLALVLEPKYRSESEEVSIRDLLLNQMSTVALSHPKIKCQLLDDEGAGSFIARGTPHLLRRLFRNIFDNACSFARTHVTARVQEINGQLVVTIRDDGPGLTNDALANFGKKKAATRYQVQTVDERISVGLGSVIMQTIASAHAGSVKVENLIGERGQVVGAELTVILQAVTKIAA